MTEDVPRDPSAYYPTEHASIRKRDRDFEWPEIADVIENGEIYDWSSENVVLFHSEEFTVPVNYDQGAIITVCDVGLAEYLEYVEDNGDPIVNL